MGCIYNYSHKFQWHAHANSGTVIPEAYTILPGTVELPSNIYDGQTLKLISFNATKICFSDDPAVTPICPTTPGATACDAGDMYIPNPTLLHSVKTRSISFDFILNSSNVIRAIGCRYDATDNLVQGILSEQTIKKISVVGSRFHLLGITTLSERILSQ